MKNVLLGICLLLAFSVAAVANAAEGNSVAGLKVTLKKTSDMFGGTSRGSLIVGQTTTGPDGYYMIRGVGPGVYKLHIEGYPDKRISLGGGGNVTGKVKPN
jgi:hypothetical protein